MVRIMNTEILGQRLAYSKVKIGNHHFADLPQRTENGKWYTLKSKSGNPVVGDFVKVMSTQPTCLQIAEIEVYGYDYNAEEIL